MIEGTSLARTRQAAARLGKMPLSRWDYNRAERDAYRSFVALHGPIVGGQKGFRRLLREHRWKVPHHYRTTSRSRAIGEAEKRFEEEGLGRFGAYTRHRYPEADDFSEDSP